MGLPPPADWFVVQSVRPAAFAVTTRSRLKGTRLFPLMLFASLRIRRQLARTPGVVRWASIVAGPREFWTITTWETRDKMLDFMRSGAHEDIMWLFGKWLESFWLMRWAPTSDEQGVWKGTQLAARAALPPAPSAVTAEAKAALDAVFGALPGLRASAGPAGAPGYDYAPSTRRRRSQVAGGSGLFIRAEMPGIRGVFRTRRTVRELRRILSSHSEVLRHAAGFGRIKEAYAMAVIRDDRSCTMLLADPRLESLRSAYGDGRFWAMRWRPDNEFGHWDGLRLRREKLGTAIHVPPAAAAAGREREKPPRVGIWGRRKQR